MCGRFTLRAPASAVAKEFGLFDVPDLMPHFIISLGQTIAIVKQDAEPNASYAAQMAQALGRKLEVELTARG
jgi:putative SOS response-associated peptidase YedK